MAEVASAYVSLLPSARGFGTEINRQVGPQVKRSGMIAGAGLGRSLLKGFIVFGALTKISQFVGGAFDEAREAVKVGALVDNAIEATGGVAKVTAAQVDRLANAFSRKTGIDDEQIATSASLLLTFKNVRREGSGLENIFNRATRASADLAAAGFGSMDSAAKMLGKALNLPEKGLTALTRAGVQFTAQQTERIKSFIEEGRLLRAQKILLREVESQVGGAAEATATYADKSRVALNNIKEQIGTALLPALNSMGKVFVERIAPAVSGFITNLQNGTGSSGRFAAFIRTQVVPVLQQYYTWLFTKVVPAIREGLVPWIERGRKAFNDIRAAVQRNEPELRQLFNAFKAVANFVATKLIPAQIALSSRVLPVLTFAIKAVVGAAATWVRGFNATRGAVNSVETAVVRAAVGLVAAKNKIVAAFKGLPATMKAIGIQIIAGLVRGIASVAGQVTAAINAIVDKIPKIIREKMGISSPSKVTHILGLAITDGLVSGLKAGEKKVIAKVAEVIGKVKDRLSTARSDFAGLVDPISSAFTGDLFSGATASEFVSNLLGTQGQLTGLIGAFKTLIGQGLNPKFLYGLFQSGNAGLILDLARNRDLAAQAGGLFGEINQLSTQLGTAVAGATPEGKELLGQIKRLEKEQKETNRLLKDLPPKVGDQINAAARSGRRRAA